MAKLYLIKEDEIMPEFLFQNPKVGHALCALYKAKADEAKNKHKKLVQLQSVRDARAPTARNFNDTLVRFFYQQVHYVGCKPTIEIILCFSEQQITKMSAQ